MSYPLASPSPRPPARAAALRTTPLPAPALDPAAVVARLRAAGCVFAEEEARLLIDAAAESSTPTSAGTPADTSTGSSGGAARLAAMVELRAAGRPLEHIVGWAGFAGLRIAVDPGVFVPRRRTEFLAATAVALAPPRPVAVDLCCGSGALGAALAVRLPGTELHAADIDPAAVRCARRNVRDFGGRVYEGDLYAPLPAALRGRVDVLLANVPYVPTEEIGLLPTEAREHEARAALDGGADGLDVLRRVAAEAGEWLAPGGSLLFETGERQASRALGIVAATGLAARVETSDEWWATVVVGRRTPW
ncbi:putative protein N(5)-glutamine methyltransferase [Streptomyces sp. NPDC058953]|uniref:putative protein N(5)-glutamine methyltransferase n=1 Tax=unclassified Streptomyces TaxID=2593676 RepID=UPI0036C208D6